MEPLLLSCIESRVENSRNFYGRFQLGPFVLGQGLTIANSLRRSLLSEISGLAITAVEIEGVVHEYSTIEGVRESVLDILLNVKQIVLTSDFQIQEPQIAFLQVQGPGIIRAKDIKLPISIQSVDPEQYIATLLYDGLLKIKFMICRGKNYLVQTPLGLKIPNSPPPSYKKQEEAFSELKAEVFLTKSSQSTKQNISSNPSLSKKSTESSFTSFLQIENLQDFTLDTPEGLTNTSNIPEGSQVNKNKVFDYGVTKAPLLVRSKAPKQQSKSVKEIMLKEEENNAVFTSHKLKNELTFTKKMLEVSGLNNDVTIDLSNDIQSDKKNSSVYETSSEKALLNTNRAELSSLPNAEKKTTIDSKVDISTFVGVTKAPLLLAPTTPNSQTDKHPLHTEGMYGVFVNQRDAKVLSTRSGVDIPDAKQRNVRSKYPSPPANNILTSPSNKTESFVSMSAGDVKAEISGVGTRNKPQRVLGVGTRRDVSKSPSNISFGDVKILEGGRRDVRDVRQKQHKELKKTSNILPIDAVFMPINRVNFAIELNNESEAPKDLVILEIWTNGSIHPKQAINEAAKALIQLIAPFQEAKIFKPVFINSPKGLQRSLSSSCATVTNLGLPAQKKKNLRLLPLHNILTDKNKVFSNPPDILKGHGSTKNNVFVNLDFPSETIDIPNIFRDVRLTFRPDILTSWPDILTSSKKMLVGDVKKVASLTPPTEVLEKKMLVGDVKQGEKEMSKAGVTDHKSLICQAGPAKIAKQESTWVDDRKHRNSLLNKNIASLDIGNLNLSFRPYTCLKRAKIETVADLLQYSAEDLLNLKNFGKRSLDEISQSLNEMGLKLRS